MKPNGERFLRLDDVLYKTGLGRSTVYELIKKGEFPNSIKLTSTQVAWLESEIENWIKNKVEQHRKKEEV